MISKEIEINQLDTSYKNFRCGNSRTEKNLLTSISQTGISTPLSVVEKNDANLPYLLLDGFKRLLCAQKLGLQQIPVSIIGDCEVTGVLRLLCCNQSSNLNALEEAVFIENLNNTHGLSCSEIAIKLNRSVSWVSLRIEMSRNMSDIIREKILSGKFPLRSYMYDLLTFTRVKEGLKDVEKFVTALSGKEMSTRDITLMSTAYFRGDKSIKQQILDGNCDWTLRMLKNTLESSSVPKRHKLPEQNLSSQLNCCYNHLNLIIQKLAINRKQLSERSLKPMLTRLNQSCNKYVTILNEENI